jgi:hypothetical protein
MAAEVTRLRSASPRLLARELFACTATELQILEAVGEPSSDNAFGTGPPTLVWDVAWPCGLTASLELLQLEQRLVGYLDRLEVDHALRHLGLDGAGVWLLEREEPDAFAQLPAPLPVRFDLWCTTDDGTKERLAEGITEGNAQCWREQLEDTPSADRVWLEPAS